MDRLFNKILFFILMPFFVPTGVFIHLTYPWWHGLRKGGFAKKVLFYALGIIYMPISWFLRISYEWWSDLVK